jgi:hypothetical protein
MVAILSKQEQRKLKKNCPTNNQSFFFSTKMETEE